MSSSPEEDFENAKAICANLGLPEPTKMTQCSCMFVNGIDEDSIYTVLNSYTFKMCALHESAPRLLALNKAQVGLIAELATALEAWLKMTTPQNAVARLLVYQAKEALRRAKEGTK